MARKSRKHKYKEELKSPFPVAVGYIRLSVANKEKASSIENQKFIIECWGEQQQIPISHYYIDNGFSGLFSFYAGPGRLPGETVFHSIS